MSFNYGVSLSGLRSAETLLNVTQQNISNMNTEGYIRQRVQLASDPSGQGSGVLSKIGNGVRVLDIEMISQEILVQQYNKQVSNVKYFETLSDNLYVVETLVGEYTEDSLNNVLDNFFNAWEEFSKFPEEASYRFALVGETKQLTRKINHMSNELTSEKTNLNIKLNQEISEVNTILESLANVNKRINESGMDVPNSILNDRNTYLEKLSNYLDIDISYESSNPNMVTVRSGGTYLVSAEKSYELKSLEIEGNEGLFLTNGSSQLKTSGGSIFANLDAINKYIVPYEEKLNNFVKEMKDAINDIHKVGFSMENDTSLDFFVGNGASNLSLNPDLETDVTKIASSSFVDNEGDVSVAKKISNLFDEVMNNGDGLTFKEYVGGYAIEMAQDLNTIKLQHRVQNDVLQGIKSKKDSVEGVSLEEEMTILMSVQKYYTANAKMLKSVDDTFKTLMQLF